MTIAKITAGDGYLYLTRHVANGDTDRAEQHDAAAYFSAEGNPPGRWIGRGAHLLALDGKQVNEDQMRALFGYGQHPEAEAIITAYLEQHAHAGMTAKQLKKLGEDAIKQASLGRPFPAYAPLGTFNARVGQRLDLIRQETGRDPTESEIKKVSAQEARRQRAAVAGFDLVFSPVKSAALLWALDERAWVREAIRDAHERAMEAALDLVEDHAAYTRTGTGGIAQIGTKGLTGAAFDHYDSRAGDPNLHTHVAISAKVQGTDGRWRALDARALYRMTVAASEHYNTCFEAALTASLGVSFAPRPDTAQGKEPVREISDVPSGMVDLFSRRRKAVESRYAELLRQYRDEHGHDPSAATCHKLARQANLDTRQGKKPPRSLEQMRRLWRDELTAAFGGDAVTKLMAVVPASGQAGVAAGMTASPDTAGFAERVIATVAQSRSTWTAWNLRAEAERQIRYAGITENHRQLTEAITARAIALSVSVEAPSLLNEPDALRRADGESVFTDHGASRYTSDAVLDAEARLLRSCSNPTSTGSADAPVVAALDGYEAVSGTVLDAGQRHLVSAFTCDPRLLLAGLGPAGSGKTTAMRALAHVLRQRHRRLIPLATSAVAADVLGRELGTPAENLHKFLHEWSDRGAFAARLRAGGTVPAAVRMFAVNPGDLLLIDEAGMAGTFALDEVVAIAARRGAVVRLLGDDRQLSAVETGGALRLIAAQPGTPELSVLYRFRDPEEAQATLAIRAGDGGSIDWYIAHDRVRSGSHEAMSQATYEGWKADMLAGKITLMAAGSSADVAELAARARAERVTAGQVEAGGVELADGNTAGAGDWIITRTNNRMLTMHGGRDWVKNGDGWRVLERRHDGSLRIEHIGHHGRVTVPAAYVASNVELMYATTAHRSQGVTVDTAHPLITGAMNREMLYVLASRAREKTMLYVATHDLPFDEDASVDKVRSDPDSYAAHEILLNIVATAGAELSATESIRAAQDRASSLATLVPQHLHAAHDLADARYRIAAASVFGDEVGNVVEDPAWGAVVRRLYEAECHGWDPRRLLAVTAGARELGTAESIAEVMCWRIDAFLSDHPEPPAGDRPYEDGAHARSRITSIINDALGASRSARAQSEPAWPALLAALRRAENVGHSPGPLVTAVVNARELRTARSISETLAWRISRYVAANPLTATSQPAEPSPSVLLPPWVTAPPADDATPIGRYLRDAAALIAARCEYLADDAISRRPGWMALLGEPPGDRDHRDEWRRCVSVIAAYRDQYQVATDDPLQVLGPYAEPGHAGYHAYWHAAESVLAARRATGLEDRNEAPRPDDAVLARIAIATYNGLPAGERETVSRMLAERLGPLWFGDRRSPDGDAAAKPVYATHLADVLAERRHLNASLHATSVQRRASQQPLEAQLVRRRRGNEHRAGKTGEPSDARLAPRASALDFVRKDATPSLGRRPTP